jgi:4-hydroxybutyryl-CoA dehydratase/vinylacetyl-CoA-Delta-isomerase
MMTGDQYRMSLLDGRRNYMDGERIEDMSKHPLFRPAVDWVASTYDRFYSSEPGAYHPMFMIPRTPDDLRARSEALRQSDITGGTTAACMALITAAPQLGELRREYRDRVYDYVELCRGRDLRCSEVITDAKGHRKRRPNQQDDPDFYVRIVDRSSDGIVINGCKMHITGAALVHEQVVLPTKRMRRGEEAYAVACAVPSGAEGLTIINTTNAPRDPDPRNHPVSSRRNMPDGFVVFDQVFVPNERVFLAGEVSHSAILAHALGVWERSAGVAGAANAADLLVGQAALLAEMTGQLDDAEIRQKLAKIVIYATMCRAGWEAAMATATTTEDGTAVPNSRYVSATKHYTMDLHGQMVDMVQDIAGRLIVACPGFADLDHPEIRERLAEAFAVEGDYTPEQVMRLLHYLRDTTADLFGGWLSVTEHLAGAGAYAQRLVTLRNYDLEEAKQRAKRAIGIAPGGGEPQDGGSGSVPI